MLAGVPAAGGVELIWRIRISPPAASRARLRFAAALWDGHGPCFGKGRFHGEGECRCVKGRARDPASPDAPTQPRW